mgnify:CR=1 FL=1
MSQEVTLSATLIVKGEISPYSFTDEKTGEVKAGINIRTSGRVYGLFDLDPKHVERMNEGEWWEVHGDPDASISKGGGIKYSVKRPTYLKRLREAVASSGPVFDFGDGASASKPAAAKS